MTGSKAVGSSIAAADDDHSLARRQDLDFRLDRVPEAAPVLLRQVLHRKMNPLQLASRNVEIARMFSPAREYDGIEVAAQILHRNILSQLPHQ